MVIETDKNVFITYAKAVSKLFDGAIMPKWEDEFYSILFGLAYNIKMVTVSSELNIFQSKLRGRPRHLDLLVILNEAGLIVELKFAHKSLMEALCQIRIQHYEAVFDNYKNVTKKIPMDLHTTKEWKVSVSYQPRIEF